MADVKLFRPQRLTDNADGGGLATAIEVVDGQVNNLYDDISRIDRVNGELSLRKVFAQAATADTELYSDLHVIVQAPPQDPRVAAVLFRTKSWSDERSSAQAQVERYLDESVISRMVPYDRQLEGQRTVLVFQRPELALPEIGEVYALKVDSTGVVEFIRVSDMDHGVETFTDEKGEFKARIITLTISQPLSREFAGSQPNRYFSVGSGKAVVRKTVASDAARYKGVTPLAVDANAGDMSIRVESVYAQLVPAATSEVAVVDAQPAGTTKLIEAASADYVDSWNHYSSTGGLPQLRHYSRPMVPGTAGVERDGVRFNWVDDGQGRLLDGTAGMTQVGRIDYAAGTLTLDKFPVNATGAVNGVFRPAAVVSGSSLSEMVPVEVQNRGYVYVKTLRPIPAPGSLVVSYRALGKWYTLEDDGSGALVGENGTGSGQVNFQTGSVQLTLGALPDIGSAVIYAYGASTTYDVRDGDLAIKVPAVVLDLEAGNCEPGTLSIKWLAGGVLKTATDNGAGALTGHGTGEVLYATGQVLLRPSSLPDSNTQYTVDYEAGTTVAATFNPVKSGLSVTLALGQALREGSLQLSYTGELGAKSAPHTLRDNGLGQLVDEAGAIVSGSTVNYGTGQITFPPAFTISAKDFERAGYTTYLPGRTINGTTGSYGGTLTSGNYIKGTTLSAFVLQFTNGNAMSAIYKAAAAVDTVRQDVVPAQPLRVDLVPLVSNTIVPGGLLFLFGGLEHYDIGGVIYRSMSSLSGAGTAVGTVDYAAGVVTLTSWTGGVAPAFAMKALLTEVAPLPQHAVHGRTPGSPLRPGTFSLRANRYDDGVLISGISDNNGNIDTADMHGFVDANTGFFSVGFGAYVLDSTLSAADKAEPWYHVSNVATDGYIWRPREVLPGSVQFNCVVQTSLPQDPDIIKVNPVRLPMDGRVQAIRAGDTLVIHDTQPQTLPGALAAGQVVALARSGVESVAVYDQVGLGVDPALYSFDKVSGDITFASPLDLSAYQQPLVLLHTVEDMALCIDAQITGEVSLGHALTHSYNAGQSLVSAALILGDAQARYEHMFAQATWTNVWSDSLIGAAPSSGAKYNDATYPVEVLNRDAITQKWRLAFTSSTAFNIVGDEVGVIGTGTTSSAVAPINPATGQPYFGLQAAGFGSGWATGNTIRFNTVAAGGPIWTARTVLSGPATQQDDLLRLQLRWDKD